MTTGEKIKSLRKQLNMTQEAFADSIKVSRRSIMDWEHDKYTPQTESIMEICKVYHLDLSYFIEEEQAEIQPKEDNPQIIKNNIFVNIKEKEKFKENVIKKYKIHKWYNLFFILVFLTPITSIIVACFDESLIDYLVYLFFLGPIIFYILFRKFRDNYIISIMKNMDKEVFKSKGAIQRDYPLYVRMNDDLLSFWKENQLLINVKTNDIKKIVLFLNDSMMNELLPPVTKKVYTITMQIYYTDGNKSYVSVYYNLDTKLTDVINDMNKRLLIDNFNKIYIKYKK